MELKRGITITIFALLTIESLANASDKSCFEFSNLNTPARLERLTSQTGADDRNIWCYEPVRTGSKSYELVYKLEAESTPELSMLVEIDGNGYPSAVTHETNIKGGRQIHTIVGSGFSPLGIPLSSREAAKSGSYVYGAYAFDSSLTSWAQSEALRLSMADSQRVDMRVQVGTFESELPDEKQPFKGYWWSGNELSNYSNAPLAKYDAFVKARTGTDPASVAWENANHTQNGTFWSGHCNGWAASSVLYPEPTQPLWDTKTKALFLVSDLKGILAEASFCANWAFYGNRYWGNPGDDLLDIYPDLFHKVLVYYIDQMKLPIAFDYERDEAVDNHVISGYKFDITKDPNNPQSVHVVATLRVHSYDNSRTESVGKEPYMEWVYNYTLSVDSSGNILSGKWDEDAPLPAPNSGSGNQVSTNPDFLWVPLSPSENCTTRNASISLDQVNQILALPPAQTQHVPINFNLNRALAPNESVTIPIPSVPPTAMNFTVHWSNNSFASDNVSLMGNGTGLYWDGSYPFQLQFQQGQATGSTSFQWTAGLQSLVLQNNGSTPTKGTSVTIDWIEYLAGQ